MGIDMSFVAASNSGGDAKLQTSVLEMQASQASAASGMSTNAAFADNYPRNALQTAGCSLNAHVIASILSHLTMCLPMACSLQTQQGRAGNCRPAGHSLAALHPLIEGPTDWCIFRLISATCIGAMDAEIHDSHEGKSSNLGRAGQ